MAVLFLILLVLAAACFALGSVHAYRGRAYAQAACAGLFFWVLVPLIQAIQALAA